jgi:CheY-like chemotaxis protein
VAKILVADDNSNVQKTVALALTDLSVEVVAVNNGEAAVRRLADITPDLILADIFMPVRNGYEVCEFVKKDPRFAQVPVVLLVGAFDPLDEHEAQRVGADGILKKPFVPPDPLIAMVKTLLDRSAGDRLVTVGAAKPAAAAQQGKSGGITAVEDRLPAPAVPSAPEPMEEVPLEEFHPPVERVSFGEGERPVAFGQLLETPAEESTAQEPETVEPVDDTQVLTSSRDASLGEPIFWKTEEPEPESDEEHAETDEEDSSEAPMRAWTPEINTPSQADADPLEPVEPFELVREQEESGQSSSVVESGSLIAQDPASQASLTVQSGKAEDLAANPTEWMASVPPAQEAAPPSQEEEPAEAAADWSANASEPEDTVDSIEAELHKTAEEAVASQSPAAPAPVSSSPSTLALPSMPSRPVSLVQPHAKTGGETASPNKTHPSLQPSQQSTEDTARSVPKQEWADLAATLLQKPGEPALEKSKAAAPPAAAQTPAAPAANAQPASPSATQSISPAAASADSTPANSALPPTPDPALVEAVVQRVLDKMRPQVVDIITKEFLRPVVQALVHREITKR